MGLSKHYRNLLASFDKKKPVFIQYNVCDCENEGDMRDARADVEWAIEGIKGARIVREYWDGRDCGEAYILYSVPCSSASKVIDKGVISYDPYQ